MIDKQPGLVKRPFRNDIQGLRGVAIIAVLLFHFGFGGINGGFLGVDIFFVISGFLITSILLRNTNSHPTSNLLAFYAKRFWRIFPAYIVVILFTLAAGWFFLLPDDLARLGRSAGFSSVFSSNFFFFKESGYFDLSGIFKPLLHTWSLAVEIQFYLVWPLLLLLFSTIKNRTLASTLTIFFAAMLILSTALSIGDHKLAFFMMYTRLWEFAIGGWVAVKIAQDNERAPSSSSTIWGTVALATLLISFFAIDKGLTLPAPGALIPALATGVLIYLGARSALTFRLLSLPVLVWIGEISYSLYLVHWPLIVYLNYVLYPEPSLLVRALALFACLPLAFLLYRSVEVPFRDRGKKQPFSPILTIPAIGSLSLTLLICAIAINTKGMPTRYTQTTLNALANLEPKTAHLNSSTASNTGNAAAPKLVLWGDSHAGHFGQEVRAQALAANYKFALHTFSGCPPIPKLFLKRHSLSIPKGCFGKNNKTLTAILQDKRIVTVILAARWDYYAQTRRFASEGGRRAYLTRAKWAFVSVEKSQENFANGLQKTADQLIAAGKRVVILGQVPEFDFDPPRCVKMSILTAASNEICKIKLNDVRKRHAYAEQLFKKMSAASPMIRYVQTSDVFCNKSDCSPLLEGKIAYKDDDHINDLGARNALRALRLRPASSP